jgi:hypothetical protein
MIETSPGRSRSGATPPRGRRTLEDMSLSQPSRTIVVEPVQTSTTAPAEPPGEPPRRVEAAPAASPPEQTPARP